MMMVVMTNSPRDYCFYKAMLAATSKPWFWLPRQNTSPPEHFSGFLLCFLFIFTEVHELLYG